MTSTVIDLDARATILDAADRLAAAPTDAPIVFVVPAGAPFARNAVFLEVARSMAGERRLAVVSSDPRARSIAASVHVPAYSSLGALEREELDPTEKLGVPRRAAAAITARRAPPSLGSPGRAIGIAASVLGAIAVLLMVTLPSAAVTVSVAPIPMPAATFTVRAGPGGDVPAQPLAATITTKVTGAATGSRTEDVKATGSVRFANQTTDDISIPKGTVVQTSTASDRIQFATTETKTLPRSIIIGITLVLGQVDVAVEAVAGGPAGNVAAGRIIVSNRSAYTVTNPAPTSGGVTKKIPIVKAEDYTAATVKANVDKALADAANEQKTKWSAQLSGSGVIWVGTPSLTSQGSLSDVVDKEVATFDVPVTGSVQGFAVAADQPTKAAAERYRTMASPGYALDERTAQFGAAATVADNGVTWKVTASGTQSPLLDPARVRGALAGRTPAEARELLAAQGLKVTDLRISPSWWPRMPLLDARIAVN
ncbi:MAG: baseplate J/gp47 family protein [Chloroflexota bacterium]|nr:baseplate J/gp47 family protein [Chloroflexota bacterium]